MNNSKTPIKGKRIVISKNGPYLVSNNVPVCIQTIVSNKEGMSWDWEAGQTFETESEYALCRCEKSRNMPFCDESHKRTGFDGTETASLVPYARQAEEFDGPTFVLSDVENLCAFARFCDPGGKIWGLIEQTDDHDARALVIREAMHCPAGRLVIHDRKTRQMIEEPLEPSIGIVEDPWWNLKAGFTINGKINRKDRELSWNSALEAGGVLVGDEVSISCEVELIKI